MIIPSKIGGVITLGYEGENNAREHHFDITRYQRAWPDGTPQLLITRSDGENYIAETRVEGAELVWLVKNSDLACPGQGSMLVAFVNSENELLGYTEETTLIVVEMPEWLNAENPPPAYEPWIVSILLAGDNALTGASEAKASAVQAARSESAAATSAENAANSSASANESKTASAASATAAAQSAASADLSRNAAASSAQSAATNASIASTSATQAQGYAQRAETAKTGAEESKNAAAESAIKAAQSALQAGGYVDTVVAASQAANDAAIAAKASETSASTAASSAAASASDANASKTASAQNASSAQESRAAAANSALAAASSESKAKNSADSAASSASSAAQALAGVNAAGAAQVAAIEQKGAETLKTIPDDYTALSGEVSSLKDQTANMFGVKDSISPMTSNGITITPSGSTLTLDGMATAGANLKYYLGGGAESVPFAVGDIVTFTVYPVSGTYTGKIYMSLNNVSGTAIQPDAVKSVTFAWTSSMTNLQFYVNSGTVIEELVLNVQIEAGEKATDFYPYGITAKDLIARKAAENIEHELKKQFGVPDEWTFDKRAINKMQGDGFSFAIQTDAHWHDEKEPKYYTALKNLSNIIGFDFIANLGDTVRGYEYDTVADSVSECAKVVKGMMENVGCPAYFSIGNHDNSCMYAAATANIDNAFLPGELYAVFGRPAYAKDSNIVWGSKGGMYFYRDYDALRVIMLNTSDLPYEEVSTPDIDVNHLAMSDAQVSWLEDVALNTTKPVLVLSHAPLADSFGRAIDNKGKALSALSAFVSTGGTVVACVAGHMHELGAVVQDGINHIVCLNGEDKCEVFAVDLEGKTITTQQIGEGFNASRSFTFN